MLYVILFMNKYKPYMCTSDPSWEINTGDSENKMSLKDVLLNHHLYYLINEWHREIMVS